MFVFVPDCTATYDENGYVTSVSYNGKTHTYTYDGVGRLSSETVNGTTKTYSYDSANNVQKTGGATKLRPFLSVFTVFRHSLGNTYRCCQ
ncbi:MAG: RHS repeat protein [Clostridia bacterium]|nr:RHS repeat protein [Clostridia bacterium]